MVLCLTAKAKITCDINYRSILGCTQKFYSPTITSCSLQVEIPIRTHQRKRHIWRWYFYSNKKLPSELETFWKLMLFSSFLGGGEWGWGWDVGVDGWERGNISCLHIDLTLKGPNFPSLLRVPSGKKKTDAPFLTKSMQRLRHSWNHKS